MATAAEVDRALKDLLRRIDGADTQSGMNLPSKKRVIALRIRDLGVTYRTSFADGRFSRVAKVESPTDEDVRVAVTSDDFIALAEGRVGLASALLTGRLRIQAGARDLLLLRQLL